MAQDGKSRLVGLTTAQGQTSDDLSKQDERIDGLEALMEGDPLDKDDEGLRGDVKDAWKRINQLVTIMAPDNLGAGGWENRLRAIEDELGLRRRGRLSRKAFLAAVVTAAVATTAFFITNWDAIEKLGSKITAQISGRSAPQKTKGKRSSGKKRTQAKPPPIAAPTEASDGTTEKDVQQ